MNNRNTELEAIRKTIVLHIDGVREGNVAMLKNAFHSKAMMYGCNGTNVTIVEIEGLYAYVEANEAPAKRGEPHQYFITAIDYTGNAAFVEMTEESSQVLTIPIIFNYLKLMEAG